jgi:DNA-binding transcriptional ArsR family regulator
MTDITDRPARRGDVPADDRAIGPDVADAVAVVLKALADPLRLRMLSAITTAPGGEAHVGDLAELAEVSQPTVSHHLKVLRSVGVLTAERRGTAVFYRVAPVYRTATTTLLDRFAPAVADAAAIPTPDDPGVHYQSYTSIMSRPSSDRVLSVPFQVIKALGEENDGLVSVDSAKWGEFRGVLRSTTRRGVSHGDLVDMHREDYAGFNVLDAYITIVADLRRRGY